MMVLVSVVIPSNVVLAEKFAERFDGFSIGSNDLTQLVLGVDRDSAELSDVFDERNEAVKSMIYDVIRDAHKKECKVGICGEHGGDPASVEFCNEIGLDYVSCSPFRVPIARLAAAQAALGKVAAGEA